MSNTLKDCISPDDELTLLPLREEDAVPLFQLVDANRAYLRAFLGWLDTNQSVEDTLAFIKSQQTDQLRTFSVRFKGKLAGLVGLQQIDHLNKSAAIGYWLAEPCQGKGIMTRSVKALLDYAHYSLGLHRIEIRCAVENLKSQAIPERLGLRREARLSEAIWHYGSYLDVYIYTRIFSNHNVLETERMVLRKFTEADVDSLQRLFTDPEVMRYYPGTRGIEETRRWIAHQLKSYEKRGYGLYACHLKESGEFAGWCGLCFWKEIGGREEVEIGYMFDKRFWKRGLATEAAKSCLEYARNELGMRRLISLIRPENAPSRRVAERLGMQVEKEAELVWFKVLIHVVE